MLEGSPAREHLRRVAERYPERFEEFGEELRNRGYQPTDDVTVVRSRMIGVSDYEYERSLDLPWQRVSTSVTSSQGEIVLHSWDDGYDGTWEGLIYTERYSDGAWSTNQGQINIETASYYSVWSVRTGGGIGGGGNPWEVGAPDATAPYGFTQVSAVGGLDYYLVGPGPFSPFVACLIAGSIGCSGACFYLGPFWPQCMAGCAALVMLNCSLANMVY